MVVDIMSEKRVADDQKQQVEADEQRINKEALECKAISDDAQRDLAVALPALEAAMMEVDKLDKSSISEVKAYTSPPPLVLRPASHRSLDFGPSDVMYADLNFGSLSRS